MRIRLLIFVRHEFNQAQKQVAAAHEKMELDILAPTGRRTSATLSKQEVMRRALDEIVEDDITGTDGMDIGQTTLIDLSEGKI